MSPDIHIAAAASQLTRALFSETQMQGSVVADENVLEVAVLGIWPGIKLQSFAGYDVTWREVA
ncbi:hypothetical protein [Dongia sp.]|uniref:hypothetical protein n=1 Tax=Dongia sp. TaxID=1977262 RepID=UPI003751FF60